MNDTMPYNLARGSSQDGSRRSALGDLLWSGLQYFTKGTVESISRRMDNVKRTRYAAYKIAVAFPARSVCDYTASIPRFRQTPNPVS